MWLNLQPHKGGKMLNSIIDGISLALSNSFDGLDIYTEPVEQGMKKPCFEVVCNKVECKQLLGNRYQYFSAFNIIYHPAGHEPNNECLNQLEVLSVCLSKIQVEDIVIRARNISAEIVDNKLIFACDYNLIFFKLDEQVKMGVLESNNIKINKN